MDEIGRILELRVMIQPLQAFAAVHCQMAATFEAAGPDAENDHPVA